MFTSKHVFLIAATLIAPGGLALAAPIVDFVPQKISFQRGLDDDVSGSSSQHITLVIKNVGNTPSRYPGSIMRVLLNGAVLNANVYGANGVGGYNLHAPIAPGQTGIAMMRLPLGTLRHCTNIVVKVDADRTYQYGGNVFANDTKTLLGVDPSSIRACVPPIIHRFDNAAIEGLDVLED